MGNKYIDLDVHYTNYGKLQAVIEILKSVNLQDDVVLKEKIENARLAVVKAQKCEFDKIKNDLEQIAPDDA